MQTKIEVGFYGNLISIFLFCFIQIGGYEKFHIIFSLDFAP
nr:MAG TPA: hypothetical protein [Bacteriophage sp.]DAU46284.1 MAG TPA: hypothetical protein [Bacteriophage sp.]